jgi:ribosomal protein S18 acetylase RimI-like enzyme
VPTSSSTLRTTAGTHARAFREPHDLRAMQRLAEEVWRLDPAVAQETVGDLAWMTRQHAGLESEWRRQLWLDGDRVVAWGWIKPSARLFWQVDPRLPELLEEVFGWFEDEAAESPASVTVWEGNRAAIAALERRGFGHDPEAPWIRRNGRDLVALEEPHVRLGYRLTTMAESPDLAARVAVHRAAFHPSRVTEESYARVMAEWPYRPELDCAVVAPDGSFASYALGWLDETNAVGLLEPVGTHPHHRRLGLARAACLLALRQLRAAGAERALVGSRGDAAYPVPTLLYESIGFRELSRALPFVKIRA